MDWAWRLGERPREQPWGEWLPTVGHGVVSAWLQQVLPEGGWVVDPLVAAPEVTVEMAQAGYRVLAITSNPVLAFLLRAAAVPPAEEDLRATLAALAATPKGDQRLEPYLRGLYATPCPRCGQPTEAQAYLWERKGEREHLVLKEGVCTACGRSFAAPVDEDERRRFSRWEARAAIHRARLAERVAPLGAPLRAVVERYLGLFPARTLEALTTLLGRRSDPALAEKVTHLDALLLLAVAAAWPQDEQGLPWTRTTPPRRYRERNLWAALEEGLPLWTPARPAVPLVTWPQTPPEQGGIVWFQGRVRHAQTPLRQVAPRAVVAVVPPPQPVFWSLAALATAWLWGRDAMAPLEPLVGRRRDWGWYTAALAAAWHPLARALPEQTPFFLWMPVASPELLTAAVIAAHHTGWVVESVAPQSDPPGVQMVLRRAWLSQGQAAEMLQQALQARNAPTPHLTALAAALQGYLPVTGLPPEAAYAQARHDLNLLFAEGPAQPVSEAPPEETFWLAAHSATPAPLPLDDRVEEALLGLLTEREAWDERALLDALCARFPGWLTPDGELLHRLLEHYAHAAPEGWQLRPEEHPSRRASDLAEMRGLLRTLGERLGCVVRGDLPLRWEQDGREVARFYPTYLARIAPLLQAVPPGEAYLVLPGSRVALWLFKADRDPRVRQALQQRWRVLKFRHLRRLAQEVKTWADWQRLRDLDPPEHQDAQLALL